MTEGVIRLRTLAGATALIVGLLAVALALPGTGPAQAYDPAPTPTATATPIPTPTPLPSPSPTITPALPPEPNTARNPPNPVVPQLVAPGIVEVSRVVALRTPPRFFVYPATSRLAGAPRADRRVNGRWVPIYRAGEPIRLVARVPADTTFRVLIRRQDRRAQYSEAGFVVSDANGRVSLPVLRVTRRGTYIVALIDDATGQTGYVKITVGPRRT